MASAKRASMREGPLAALFRKTEADEDRPAESAPPEPPAEAATPDPTGTAQGHVRPQAGSSAPTPRSACSPRRVPSKPNGLVMIATVNAPTSCAIRATIGAAPLPVPPPAPAVMKIMSDPFSSALMRS